MYFVVFQNQESGRYNGYAILTKEIRVLKDVQSRLGHYPIYETQVPTFRNKGSASAVRGFLADANRFGTIDIEKLEELLRK